VLGVERLGRFGQRDFLSERPSIMAVPVRPCRATGQIRRVAHPSAEVRRRVAW